LLALSDAVTKLLPNKEIAPPLANRGQSAREKIMQMIEAARAADEIELERNSALREARIAELEDEIARVRSAGQPDEPDGEHDRPKVLPGPTNDRVITPTEAQVIPPGEIADLNMGASTKPPVPKTIEGDVLPPKPKVDPVVSGLQQRRPEGDEAEREANVQRLNNDKSDYVKQGLRSATHDEPWRKFVDGGMDSRGPSFWPGGRNCRYEW
jgi:hypothetical protein